MCKKYLTKQIVYVKVRQKIENFVEKFTECAENYDVYDEVEIYADNRGKKGVPKTIRDLVEGCQEAKDTLMEIAKKFKAALDSEETEDYTVTYKIEAIYRVTVQAKDLDDAIDKADSELESADFGEAIDVEGYLNRVRDESGEIVCDND